MSLFKKLGFAMTPQTTELFLTDLTGQKMLKFKESDDNSLVRIPTPTT